MVNAGKKNIVGILVDAMDYEAAVDFIFQAAAERRNAPVAAEAIHAVMLGAIDPEHQYRLNNFSLILPDAQGVRWGMNLLHKTGLRDRVYGPNLTLDVLTRAEKEGLPVYFYGSNPPTLVNLRQNLAAHYPGLLIAGMEPGRYTRVSHQERETTAARIVASGARLVFVGLGCPRQEVWAFEMRNLLPMPVLAVGAAFTFLAGEVRQAPLWMQRSGLEGVFRLCMEPRRLWRRYVIYSPWYCFWLLLQFLGFRSFPTDGTEPRTELLYG